MNALPARLPILPALGRGLSNLRANWELVPVYWSMSLVTGLLVVAGAAAPLAVVGLPDVAGLEQQPPAVWGAALTDWLASATERAGALLPALAASLVATAALWLAATLVLCLGWAGVYGVLAAGDRQAPPGPSPGWRWFRTFTLRDLLGWGRLYLWRYFWLLNLVVTLSLCALATLVALWMGVLLGLFRWGAAAAVGIGCGGALPVGFLLLAVWLWSGLAFADAALPESGVGTAARRAARTLGRRFAGLLGLGALVTAVGIGAWLLLVPLSLVTEVALAGHSWIREILGVSLSVVHWLFASAISVVWAAALVALERDELRRSAV